MADLLGGCLKLNQPEARQFLSLKRCEPIQIGSLANDGTDRRRWTPPPNNRLRDGRANVGFGRGGRMVMGLGDT
jgi:hypothetical protein